MCIWVGAGSVASWAVENVQNSAKVIDDAVPLVLVYRPPGITSSHFVGVFKVDAIPEAASAGNSGAFTMQSSNPSQTNVFLLFNPRNDVVYYPNLTASTGAFTRLLQQSSVYSVLRWPYTTKGAVDPDLEGVQEKITGGMLPMLLLLLGCGIGLKLLDYGSIKLMRFWDDKDSQRALARINAIDDPLEHKVALEAHRKAYNARFKRYAIEDRQRRRR